MSRAVGAFVSRGMAELARSYLADHGVAATVAADDAGGAAPHVGHGTGGVYLLVADADEPEARRLLAEADARAAEPDDDGPPRTSATALAHAGRWLLLLAVAGIVVSMVLSALPGS